jgi:hypothetical protein
MLNDFDITDVEKAFADAIRELGVSTHVWNNRPKVVDDSISEFAVVKVTGGISDKNAFGQCRVALYLYARDIKEMKNSARLSVMQKTFTDGIPMRLGMYIADHTPRYVGDSADDFGFHCRIISFSVIIKSA